MKKSPNKLTVFNEQVLKKIKKIPSGRLATYGQVAKALDRPGASRAVGNALNKNPWAPRVPCHRVVKSDGQVGGYNEGVAKKIRLLRQEGIKIKNNRVENLEDVLYRFK